MTAELLQDYEYEYEEDPNAIEGLPASAADLLDKPYDDGFNCDQQDAGYGYYADTLNDCKVRTDCLFVFLINLSILKQSTSVLRLGIFPLRCINSHIYPCKSTPSLPPVQISSQNFIIPFLP